MREYEDPTRPVDERVDDLLGRMTLEEKAGQLFQHMITSGPLDESDAVFGLPSAKEYVLGKHMTHWNLLGVPGDAREIAEWHNRLQALCHETRLGIPATIATDPRHGFTDNPGTALLSGPFSQWPETLGLAATRDVALMEQHADIARQEYLAVGLRTALHPQVDLATEPRWARANGTFGEDATLTGQMGAAYVRGFQGPVFGADSVSTMTKHFPGGGPQKDGEDPHFAYGREQVYPGGRFAEHLEPFKALLAAGTRQMMPYYGMPVGLEGIPEVGFGFNKPVLDLLRDDLGFDGIICTDWGLVTDAEAFGQPFPARAWGVEHLSVEDRVALILDAGGDQLGGEACPEVVVSLVQQGRITQERVDASVRRLLREKFLLGLFDERRYVDVDAAAAIVGSDEFRAAGVSAQAAAVTVLTNDGILPLAPGLRIYAEGFEGTVHDPADADVAILRLQAPYEQRGPGFESFFHAGSLDFPAAEIERVNAISAQVPTILDVYLDRPAILTPLVEGAAAVVVNFGAGTGPLLDALRGAARGRLPFDLPRSMAAVEASREDVPFDTADPLFRFGHGLTV
ncbi:glycoside hydrolase family 3 protein [Cellulomonas humilata]|uniref:beta-glucosidase n=1 Tax=Cellulomonas humilata TaxID=144055 RepID=A0A7Y6A1T1_9CELL|nr:glycoside hydrolase family 3 N-terminal domain-containing protein [Cellulomonas humilata]NUU17310.1 glycoside hydrolase family 3 protein [Cellulomonas humilata]